MEQKYVLSHDSFDRIDFSESLLSSYEVRDDSLILVVWGCALHKFNNPDFNTLVPKFFSEDGVYIAGYSEFQFTGLLSYSIETSLYEDKFVGSPFKRDAQGNEVVIREKGTVNTHSHGMLHTFDCVNLKHHGYCTVEVTNLGAIHFLFHEENLVSLDRFVRHPREYSPPSL